MKNTHLLLLLLVGMLFFSCKKQALVNEWVSSTYTNQWQTMIQTEETTSTPGIAVRINTKNTRHRIEGFGACFNELGWNSLGKLSQSDRDFILKELFAPVIGANFTVCRLPIGANDFSIDWYSYDEVEGDFKLQHFSIENDEQTLIPFIKAALSQNPSIKLWSSPWSPPTWMKRNKHYAMRTPNPNWESATNGLPEDRQGREGTDMFIMDDRYLQTYASYFGKYIDEYKMKGIDISMVMPQNEFNSDQIFPSCCWTAAGLTRFIHFLGPEMEKRNVDLYFGTMERANSALVDSVLTDSLAGRYIKGVGFQWAGKDALPVVHQKYPNLALYQTEQECGDGQNDWKGACHSWELMKHYLRNGVQTYEYWNISLEKGGISRWGWRQNSLVVVDDSTKTYHFTPEYYLMKHISHYVQPGALFLQINEDSYHDALAFVNPDKSVIVVAANQTDQPIEIQLEIDGKSEQVKMQPQSFHTWTCK